MKQFLRIVWVRVSGLLLLSSNLCAQSPGGIGRESLWLHGNFFADSTHNQTLNFNPATSAADSSKVIDMTANIEDLRRATIFTVFQRPRLEDNLPVWQMNGGFGDLMLSTRQVSSKSGKMTMVFEKPQAKVAETQKPEGVISTYVRRGVHANSENEANGDVAIRFGNLASNRLSRESAGLIAEFIVYETVLKEKEIDKIESYLALKYGITLQKDYVNSAGKTIWSRKNNAAYSNNIAGIGRDDRATLYQKQGTSCGTTDQLTIGLNKIALTNARNVGELNDGDYLIWGDNDYSFTFAQDAPQGATDILLSQKKWLIKSSGRIASTISTELRIDTKSLQPAYYPKENFYLVIDRSGTGDFIPQNCTYLPADSISADGIASFSGVQWDTDGSGKDIFSFGLKTSLSAATASAAKLLSFRVYPNPVTKNGQYTVAVTLDKPGDINVQLFDIHLHLIEAKKVSGQAIYLLPGNINGAAGVYIVKLFTPGKEYSQIVIKP